MANIFDKMVVGINKGVNTVSEGSKMLVEKAKLNTQIQDYEKERARLYQDIGTFIYNLQTSGEINIPQCNDMCDEVTVLGKKIEDLQLKIQELDSSRIQSSYSVPPEDGIACSSCGCVNTRDSKFCAGCGKPLSIPDAGAESIVCTCGRMNKSGMKFCVNCGKPLVDVRY